MSAQDGPCQKLQNYVLLKLRGKKLWPLFLDTDGVVADSIHTVLFAYSADKISTPVLCCIIKQESRAIAGRTARCRCKFRYVSNFTTASRAGVSLPQHRFLVGRCQQTTVNNLSKSDIY